MVATIARPAALFHRDSLAKPCPIRPSNHCYRRWHLPEFQTRLAIIGTALSWYHNTNNDDMEDGLAVAYELMKLCLLRLFARG
jgi:hypothetical protein